MLNHPASYRASREKDTDEHRSTVPTAGLVALACCLCGAGCRGRRRARMQRNQMSQKQARPAKRVAAGPSFARDGFRCSNEYIGLTRKRRGRRSSTTFQRLFAKRTRIGTLRLGNPMPKRVRCREIVESFKTTWSPGRLQSAGAIARPGIPTADVPLLRTPTCFSGTVAPPGVESTRGRCVLTPLLSSLVLNNCGRGRHTGATARCGAELPVMTTSEDRSFCDAPRELLRLDDSQLALEPISCGRPGLQLPPDAAGIRSKGAGFSSIRLSNVVGVVGGIGCSVAVGGSRSCCLQAGISPTQCGGRKFRRDGASDPVVGRCAVGEQISIRTHAFGFAIPGPDQTGIATLTQARKTRP